jgi:CheY-like chemotaxis protein
MEPKKSRNLIILLVEDDVIDVKTIQRALTFNGTPPPQIFALQNGEEALKFLRRQEKYENPETSPKPGIILLDLNLPRMTGLEFLRAVKTDKDLKTIPVVVFTTSEGEKDRAESYNWNIAGYFVKPMDLDKFIETVQTIIRYWTLSRLP